MITADQILKLVPGLPAHARDRAEMMAHVVDVFDKRNAVIGDALDVLYGVVAIIRVVELLELSKTRPVNLEDAAAAIADDSADSIEERVLMLAEAAVLLSAPATKQ